jgi:hypothetical protein
MISVEVPYIADTINEVRGEKGTAARCLRLVLDRSRAMAQQCQADLKTHVIYPMQEFPAMNCERKPALYQCVDPDLLHPLKAPSHRPS